MILLPRKNNVTAFSELFIFCIKRKKFQQPYRKWRGILLACVRCLPATGIAFTPQNAQKNEVCQF